MWGNPNEVGMVYEITNVKSIHTSHIDSRIRKGDVILCVEHTGDCHYTWALLQETRGNNLVRYFDIDKLYSSYGVNGVRLLEKPFNFEELLQSICAMNFPTRAAVLVPRSKEEIKKLEDTPCMMCGLKKSDVKEK